MMYMSKEAIAGFMAGSVSSAILHPFDLVKTRMQIKTRSTSGLHLLREAYSGAGIRGLYQGLSISLLGSASAWAAYFWCYGAIKDARLRDSGKPALSSLDHMISAAQAGAIVAVLTNPIWVLKTRLLIQSRANPRYQTLSRAIATIFETEGIQGFYRGLIPSLFGVSQGAIQFMVYETLKAQMGKRAEVSVEQTLRYTAMAAVSKACAVVMTYPYQVLRSRLQAGERTLDESATSILRNIWQREGIGGFYRGIWVGLLRVLPGNMITLAVYETAITVLRRGDGAIT